MCVEVVEREFITLLERLQNKHIFQISSLSPNQSLGGNVHHLVVFGNSIVVVVELLLYIEIVLMLRVHKC